MAAKATRHSGISVAEQVKRIPLATRPMVQAARRTVRALAPTATEIPYRSQPPRSKSAMWKIVRYVLDDEPVMGIGTFATYATLFFYRGRELEDASELLEGSGNARFLRLRAPADAARPNVKRLVRSAFRLAPKQGQASASNALTYGVPLKASASPSGARLSAMASTIARARRRRPAPSLVRPSASASRASDQRMSQSVL